MAKVKSGAILIMWTFTVFLSMFWYNLPGYLSELGDIFLILAVISGAVSFRISVTKKYR